MDIQPLLAYNTWLSLPREVRAKLTTLFEIPRTGEVIVRTATVSPEGNIQGEVTSDGHSAKDLYAITVEKMQSLTGNPSDNFHRLFAETVDNLDAISAGTYPVLNVPVVEEKPKKRKSKKDGTETKV